jgi:hypothetical protein
VRDTHVWVDCLAGALVLAHSQRTGGDRTHQSLIGARHGRRQCCRSTGNACETTAPALPRALQLETSYSRYCHYRCPVESCSAHTWRCCYRMRYYECAPGHRTCDSASERVIAGGSHRRWLPRRSVQLRVLMYLVRYRSQSTYRLSTQKYRQLVATLMSTLLLLLEVAKVANSSWSLCWEAPSRWEVDRNSWR